MITEDEFYKNVYDTIDEGVVAAISAMNGLSKTALAIFGGVLLAKVKPGKRLFKLFKRIFKKKDNIEFDVDSITGKSTTKKELERINSWEYRLEDVFKEMDAHNWDGAASIYKKSKYEGNTDAIKAIALKATEIYGEPPLYVYPSFNETYKAIAKICGPKVGRAVSNAVLLALKQNTSYYENLKSQELDIPNSYEYGKESKEKEA